MIGKLPWILHWVVIEIPNSDVNVSQSVATTITSVGESHFTNLLQMIDTLNNRLALKGKLEKRN